MGVFERLAPVAVELLDRVDTILAYAGAPEDHPVWPLLRHLGALPGDAVNALAAVSPGSLAAAGATLSSLAEEYGHVRAALPTALDWRGAGADSFAVQWHALRAYLDDDLAASLRRTASYLDDVESWLAGTRDAMARTLATVLTSAEAVELRTSVGESAALAGAAADIAVRVLEALADAYDRGEHLLTEWAPQLGEIPYRTPATPSPPRMDSTTEVSM